MRMPSSWRLLIGQPDLPNRMGDESTWPCSLYPAIPMLFLGMRLIMVIGHLLRFP